MILLLVLFALCGGTDDFNAAWSAAKPIPAYDFNAAWAVASPCACRGTSPDCPCPLNHVGPTAPLGAVDMKYDAAYKKAVAEKKPLIVWVDYVCPLCEKELRDCIHYHAEAPWYGVGSCRAVVGMPNKDGKSLDRHDLPDVSMARITALVRPVAVGVPFAQH